MRLCAVVWAISLSFVSCNTDRLGVRDGGASDQDGDPAPGDLLAGETGDGDAAASDGGDLGSGCRGQALPGADFGSPVLLSDPTRGSMVPVIAANGDAVMVAWHQFDSAVNKSVAYSVVRLGCVGPLRTVPGSASVQTSHPSLAPTASGFLLTYIHDDGGSKRVQALWLDSAGVTQSGPDQISAPGTNALKVDVATDGDNAVFAWTDGGAFHYALRGPRETVAAAPVGFTLDSPSVLNFPRVAMATDGAVFLAYRDGGVTASLWDILLSKRSMGGAFPAAAAVYISPALNSDDVEIAVHADGALDIVWVEQDPSNTLNFEVMHTVRQANGAIASAQHFGKQNSMAWHPVVVPGRRTAWFVTVGTFGPLYFADGPAAPSQILLGTDGRETRLAEGTPGNLHLAFTGKGPPRTVSYSWRN